jgi:hypothetical protein
MKDFKGYTSAFGNPTPASNPESPVPKRPGVDPDAKRRQLVGQIAGIIQELTNQAQLCHTDRRLLMISSAVALLLTGK